MTNYQKLLKNWKTQQEFADSLDEAAKAHPCPMEGEQFFLGDHDHSDRVLFREANGLRIYINAVALSVGAEAWNGGNGCACYAKWFAEKVRKDAGPKPKK